MSFEYLRGEEELTTKYHEGWHKVAQRRNKYEIQNRKWN